MSALRFDLLTQREPGDRPGADGSLAERRVEIPKARHDLRIGLMKSRATFAQVVSCQSNTPFDHVLAVDHADGLEGGVAGVVRDQIHPQLELSAGLDQHLRSNLTWISAIEGAWYSDGNSSLGLGTRVLWEPLWRMPIKLNHRFSSSTGFAYYGFSETNSNGYYDPDKYLSFFEEAALSATFSPRVRGRLAGRLSVDQEDGGDWFLTGRFELSATWSIWRGLSLAAGYTNSNSRLDNRPGYEIDGFYVTLGYLFW